MADLLQPAGGTPAPFGVRHRRHAWAVGLLYLTGLVLYLPGWRTAAGGSLPLVQAVHTAGGVLYVLATVGLGARFFPWPGAGRPGYGRWGFFLLVMTGLTGFGLLGGGGAVRQAATVGHAGFAAAFTLWLAWHLWARRPRRLPVAGGISRRRFLGWAGSVLAAAVPLRYLPGMLRMVGGSLAGPAGGQVAGALPGFVPYTVVNGYPDLNAAAWRLTLEAPGRPPRIWDLAALQQHPATRTRVFRFQCVTGWAVDQVAATGVDLAAWLAAQGWDPAREPWVVFFSGDGVYTESLSASQVLHYRPLLAWALDGRPLARSQGFPLRLIVPGMYGYKSLKWLVRIRLQAGREDGYWEQRGYPEDAYLGSYPL
ncbi:Oxidored_molyb domain-containing protein [Candidatus Hydrogenisulfobacillus filiaventi]|uniref:Oxidored_molyb domain-containing protein n=1 Tax=Candidatus Hydrogenisulfobacillus filiaventi TaxID=2707344 RepID=A0A6F8ZCT5_9FIRM|nr:molybdopterin-dependent oxidoreductase [Bacillota bacterium]CAB1127555.1 Oxidored_molyb domain-containing protein [Candidatus Hydrogenisulfobacillus filiaventi]